MLFATLGLPQPVLPSTTTFRLGNAAIFALNPNPTNFIIMMRIEIPVYIEAPLEEK